MIYSFNAPKEIIDDEYFMTETLAKLYLKQKNYERLFNHIRY